MTAQRKSYTEDGEHSSPGVDPEGNPWEWPEEFAATVAEEQLPACPIDLLPEPLRGFAEETAEVMGSTVTDAIVIPALCGAGALLGRGVKIQVKQHETGWKERPAMWGMLVASPSSVKSPSVTRALKPIEQLQTALNDDWVARCAVAKEEAAGQKVRYEAPPPETILFTDATGEALSKAMSPEYNHNGARGALQHRDELSGWLKSMNKYRDGDDRQIYLECWSGASASRLFSSRDPVRVPESFLCLFGTIQPDVAIECFGGVVEDGMNARFGLVAILPPDPPKWVDRAADPAKVAAYTARMKELHTVPTRLLYFSPEAGEIFKEFCENTYAREELKVCTNGFGFHLLKYPSLFARLALVFHFLEHGREASEFVSEATARAVQRFIDEYLEPHAQRLYGIVSTHVLAPGAARIAKWIREERVTKFRHRDLRRNRWKEFNKVDDTKLLEQTLNFLEAHRWIAFSEASGGRGRPTTDIIVNPLVHRHGHGGRKARNAG